MGSSSENKSVKLGLMEGVPGEESEELEREGKALVEVGFEVARNARRYRVCRDGGCSGG